MNKITLEVSKREHTGSSASNRYRREGLLPVVFYGTTTKPIQGLVKTRAFVQAGERVRSSQVFNFKSDDKELDGRHAIVRAIQQDFLGKGVLHVDFQLFEQGQKVRVKVPVETFGDPVGVKEDGGVFEAPCHNIMIACDLESVVEVINVDSSKLRMNQKIRAGDLELPKGVSLCSDPMDTLAAVVTARKAEVEAEAAATAETAEGAAAEAGEKAEAKEED